MLIIRSRYTTFRLLIGLGLAFLAAGLLLINLPASTAQENPTFHPLFPLLDRDGQNVLTSGGPVSTMTTCGACHDAAFIADHSQHADAGFSDVAHSEVFAGARPWEMSDGLYGGWNPITYRYLSSEADPRADLTLETWIETAGTRHVGGGPAQQVEGVGIEMNCFLCHATAPDNTARIDALQSGDLAWANSATLRGMTIIDHADGDWRWNAEAFNADGTVREDLIRVGDPSNENCGQCHGLVHSDLQTPLSLMLGDPSQWNTLTTGQIFSPQRLVSSGLNLTDKESLRRSFDVHAERVVGCTDCHYALNNPVFYSESTITRPDHLRFDPRRMDFGDYLYRPLHEFANTGANTITSFGSSERTCASCHDAVSTHTWLPYTERHIGALACETCHVPTLYGPALEYIDWTALGSDGRPLTGYRGISADDENLITGFEPVLLPVEQSDGKTRLAPHNLVSAWYWVYGDSPRPVRLADLEAVWFVDGAYPPDVVDVFDADGGGALDETELRLDNESKVNLIASRLAALGLENPRVMGEVQPYAIHHGVTHDEWAVRECLTCHSDQSRLNAPLLLASYRPGGVEPLFLERGASLNGKFQVNEAQQLFYQPVVSLPPANLYVLGHDAVFWIDLLGMLMFLGVFVGVLVHGGLRFLAARRLAAHSPPETRSVYMYGVYERAWHWLQTAAIFGLLLTGLVIHRPALFSMFSFPWVVLVHNGLALLLVINAALAAFYHFVSGEIRQFLPRPYGFFDQAFAQARYYLNGIFRGEPHPMEKTRDRKMNPLQQITYLAILNVLLPAQVITGALMWGAQRFPDLTAQFGGLGFLAPLHTLVAWMFATFIVMHVYLTTTGHTPLANIKAMMIGWDEVEAPTASHHTKSQQKEGNIP